MKLLSIDTATESCSVALLLEGQLFQEMIQEPRMHAKKVLPLCQVLLARHKVDIKSMDCFAFGRGPGSFTGSRIAASIIQGFGLGLKKPIVAISNLQALAQAAFRLKEVKEVVAVIDARMKEVYFGRFKLKDSQTMMLQGEEQLISLASLNSRNKASDFLGVGVGSGVSLLSPEVCWPLEGEILSSQATDIASLAAEQFKKGEVLRPEQALPVYLRNKVTY